MRCITILNDSINAQSFTDKNQLHYQLSNDCSIRDFCYYLHCYSSTGGENLRFIKCHQVVAIYDLSG